jgi:hypothetical protein
MMLLYVAWIAIWLAVYDPCLWTEAASSSSKEAPDRRREPHRAAAPRRIEL